MKNNRRRSVMIQFVLAAFLALFAPDTPGAQEVPRGEYLRYLPLEYPRLVQQSPASAALHLYGDTNDPDYRDVDPVDGIDDRRHDVLTALAVRFAPFLVQNTGDFPVNFDAYIENSENFPLHVDTWEMDGDAARLVEREAINFSVLGREPCAAQSPIDAGPRRPTMDAGVEDCKLLALLGEFAPHNPSMEGLDQPFVRQRPDRFRVLFFDFPGVGARSWERAYRAEYEKTAPDRRGGFPHAYVHPFINETTDGGGAPPAYELVLQYWFFYPSNDGGNNHEGDWEHINVVVAPLSMVTQPLSADVVARVLSGGFPATDDASDPLVIRRVEHYFHHYVMTLDFTSPNVYVPRDQWKADVKGRSKQRVREASIWKLIRHLAWVDDDETVINTHPFGYIGADNKGFDQVLSAPGGKNRNSHGTFPFPGRYHDIGPAGATEQISVFVDSRRYWKDLGSGKATTGPEFERGSVLGLADPQRLTIVPDWERAVGPVRDDAVARRNWSWLLLPVQWGYPATESPFSGIVPHADTGNMSPVGPSFSLGWNVSGPAPGFHTYEPHVLASLFPLGVQDNFRNDFGFFNLTLPLLSTLPPFDFTSRIGTYPLKLAFGRRDPVYFPKETVPFRFFALGSGVSVQVVDKDFAAMSINPDQLEPFIGSIFVHILYNGTDSTTTASNATDKLESSLQAYYQAQFYIGRRFTTENTVRNVRAAYEANLFFSNIPPYRYTALLNYWEYAGSLRYSLTTQRLHPFVKAGYGWSWYRWENARADGVALEPENSPWIKPRHIWPNVWHVGLGFEYVPWKRVGAFPGGLEVAFRVEYSRYFETLGLDLTSVDTRDLSFLFPKLGDIPANELVTRDAFDFGMSVSF